MMWDELQFAFALTVSGLSIGLMYSLIALGFVLVYKATDAINFAQGEFVMLAGFVAAVVARRQGHARHRRRWRRGAGGHGRLQLRAGARRAAAPARPAGRRRHHGHHRPRRHAARPAADHGRRRDARRCRCRSATRRSRSGRPRCRPIQVLGVVVTLAFLGHLHLVLPQEPDGRCHARGCRQPAGGDGHGHQCRALFRARLGDGRHRLGAGRRDLGQHARRRRAPGAGGPQGVPRGDPRRPRLRPRRGGRRARSSASSRAWPPATSTPTSAAAPRISRPTC